MCAFTACVRFLRRRGPAGLRFCASAEPTKSVAIAFALWYDKFNKLEFERSVKYEIPIL